MNKFLLPIGFQIKLKEKNVKKKLTFLIPKKIRSLIQIEGMRFDFPLEMQPKNARRKPKKAVKMYYAYYFMPNFIVSFYFM